MFIDGVPACFIGRMYSADSGVSILERAGDEPILRFGSSGLSDAIGVDLATGQVVDVINARGCPLLFVNASVEQFTRTVRTLIERFPYYDRDASDAEMETVANELLEIVRRIDPEAAIPDRYWSTFVDDVAIGDLSTEAVLSIDG